MKAAYLFGVKDLRVIDVPVPEVKQGEVLVRIGAATTCGTDLKIYLRGYVGKIIRYPQPFGHEWAGEVVKVGDGVEWLESGVRVRAGNTSPCFRCEYCRKGMYNLCTSRTWLWGAYAEYIKVPKDIVVHNLQMIPEHVSYEEACIAEPLACVLHGARKVGIKPGDKIVIIGSGPIGILHVQIARLMGAGKIVVMDKVEERLDKALSLGADAAVKVDSANVVDETVRELGGKADVVIEAVGLPATWMRAFGLVGAGGRLLMFGGCPPGTSITLDTEQLHYGELTVYGSFHANPWEFSEALDLISQGTVKVRPLITGECRLDDVPMVFKELSSTKKHLKIAVKPVM